MLFDNHIHTEFSADSEMQAKDALQQAERLDLGLIFTEHYDFGYPYEQDFTFSPKEYWNAYSPLRGERLRLGVELGMTPGSREANAEFLQEVPFDMVIGSIHLVEQKDLYFPEFYEGKDKGEAYRAYFAVMAEEAALQDIDVLGHIDYISRKAPYEDPGICYEEFRDEIDLVLQTIVRRGIVLELNTRRLADQQTFRELEPVYRRYAELGGKYVTLGSDAHSADCIGMNFERARELPDMLGLQCATFCERKLQS